MKKRRTVIFLFIVISLPAAARPEIAVGNWNLLQWGPNTSMALIGAEVRADVIETENAVLSFFLNGGIFEGYLVGAGALYEFRLPDFPVRFGPYLAAGYGEGVDHGTDIASFRPTCAFDFYWGLRISPIVVELRACTLRFLSFGVGTTLFSAFSVVDGSLSLIEIGFAL